MCTMCVSYGPCMAVSSSHLNIACGIDDICTKILFEGLRLSKNIENITLNMNHIGDFGAMEIARAMMKGMRLAKLSLNSIAYLSSQPQSIVALTHTHIHSQPFMNL
jgi:hypothetical protein